jgi:hypothetical protein
MKDWEMANRTRSVQECCAPLRREIDRLRKQKAEYLALLKKLEWAGRYWWPGCCSCPVCCAQYQGPDGAQGTHEHDCKLAEFIGAKRREV